MVMRISCPSVKYSKLNRRLENCGLLWLGIYEPWGTLSFFSEGYKDLHEVVVFVHRKVNRNSSFVFTNWLIK